MAFIQEMGFCTYFNIPYEFIQLNLTESLIAVGEGLLLSIIISLFLLWYYASDRGLGPKGLTPTKRWVWFALLLLACAFDLCIVSGLSLLRPLIWELLAALSSIMIVLFILGEFLSWLGKSLSWLWSQSKRLYRYIRHPPPSAPHQRHESPRAHRDPLSDFLAERVGTRTLLVVIAFIVIAFVEPWFVGNIRATTQVDFLQPSDNTSQVVLRVYGNDLICAPLASDNKTVLRSFYVLKMDDQPRPVLTSNSIGPLHP